MAAHLSGLRCNVLADGWPHANQIRSHSNKAAPFLEGQLFYLYMYGVVKLSHRAF